jgi:anti-sigma regulatory factor (Ser/Thr protein kinase)
VRPDPRPARATASATADPDPAAAPPNATELARQLEAALDAGRTFEAVDLARAAEAHDPAPSGSAGQGLRWLAALAFLRSGDTVAARALVDALEASRRRPVQGAVGARRAQVLDELWQSTGGGADLDRALEVRLARARRGGFAELAAAALLAKARGRNRVAEALAAAALARAGASLDDAAADDPGHLLDHARLALVQGDTADAEAALDALARHVATRPLERSAARRALSGLAAYGIAVPQSVLDAFPPPRLVIYCGVRDAALADQPAVAAAVRDALDAVEAEIAYGSATAGADLLFAEAALARGAELNLVLPCGIDTFRERLVAPAGGEWPRLFDRVVAAAASVTSVADDRQGLDQLLLEFGNRVIDGTARLRAKRLRTQPYLIAACDPLADSGPGGVGDFIDHWGDPARLRLVDLDELLAGAAVGAVGAATDLPAASSGQRIAGLLFADVVGFTRLDDTLLPAFWRFMAAVANHMSDTVGRAPAHMADTGGHAPMMRRSWGDALFIVADDALATADYAMALAAAFAAVDARAFGLPGFMAMRIGLHAGPVFSGRHPLTGEALVYGGNVNRAARIEPITLPGRVFASAPFVAWLTALESAAEAEVRLEGGTYRPRYRCTYRGIVELAKRYGPQAVYEVEPWRLETPMPEALIDGRRFAMTLGNDLAEHRRLAAAFARFVAPFDLTEAALTPFEIAFDEVLTNICRYAWTDAGQHVILVEAVIDGPAGDATVSITFADDGVPFDPLATAAPSLDDDIDERRMGGLGIHLVRELMDEVRYVRAGPSNRLTLIKRLAPADASSDPAAAQSVEDR